MSFGVVLKKADADLIYAIDWPELYLQSGQSVSDSEWTISPSESGGLSIATGSEDLTSGIASVKVTGGIARHFYKLKNFVELSNGEQDSREIVILIA